MLAYLSEYFTTIVVISSLLGFFELFSHSGGEDKGERLASSVIVLYLIIAPLLPIVEGLSDFDFSDLSGEVGALTGGAYVEVSEDAFREGIERLLFDKWGLDESAAVVSVFGFDFNEMKAELIMIKLLSRGASVDFREIEAYIEKSGLGECEVEYAI